MKKIGKSLIGAFLILVFLTSTNLSFAIDKQALDSQKQDNNEKITETEKKKEEVQEIKDETVKQVEQIESQIDEYQSQIDSLNNQISEANKKIEDTTEKLNQAQEDYEEQQKMLEERIVALYEAGDTTYLDALLSSEDITEFISTYYIISEIAQCDLDLLNEIDRKKTEIENAKKELEESKNQLTTAKQSKETVSTQLQNSRNEKANYVAQLSEQEKQLQAQIDEIKKDNIAIDAQIKAYQAELERKAAEERKRREEEAKKQNGGSTSSSGSTAGSGATSSSGFINPVPSAYARVTTGWYYSDGRVHGASDFGSGGISGQPVYAVADGIVAQTAALTTSYGNYVIIMHYNGLYTLYAHGQAGSICVSKGQTVKQGQQIMRVGNTGNSFGAHLHFEVRTSPGLYSNRKNPINYLP